MSKKANVLTQIKKGISKMLNIEKKPNTKPGAVDDNARKRIKKSNKKKKKAIDFLFIPEKKK
jgi:hypothetical protein